MRYVKVIYPEIGYEIYVDSVLSIVESFAATKYTAEPVELYPDKIYEVANEVAEDIVDAMTKELINKLKESIPKIKEHIAEKLISEADTEVV